MKVISIVGDRQTGKSTLLAHYINDAQECGKKVLLVGRSIAMLKSFEREKNVRANGIKGQYLFATNNYFDILAIEEDIRNINSYLKIYGKYLKKDCLIIATGDVDEKRTIER